MNENLYLYEKMSTRTRFENETKVTVYNVIWKWPIMTSTSF